MSAADERSFNAEIEIAASFTLPRLLVRQCKRFGAGKVAMREKEYGIWRWVTWKQCLESVKHMTLGLISLAFEPGDKVIMTGDNRPEALWTEMAAMCAGGFGVWVFQDCVLDEAQYVVDRRKK